MNRPPLIGVSSSIFYQDPARASYNGRPLLYLEQSMSDWLIAGGGLPVLIPYPSKTRATPSFP